MPELKLHPKSALSDQSLPHGIGRDALTVTERTGLSLAMITVSRRMRDACIDKLQTSYDLATPTTAKIVHGNGLALSWAGPGSWLAMAREWPGLEPDLKAVLGKAASVVDLSDAHVVLRIGGAMASALLAKGLSIDLHPRAFKPHDTVITLLAHIVVQLWQVDECPNFDLSVPRATIHDIVHWLRAAGGEFGLM